VYPFILATAFGLYVGILETVQRAIVPKYVSSELRGTAFGLFNVVIGTSFFVSNVMFGFLWYNYSLNLASAYSLSLSFAAIIGMILFLKSSKNKQNNNRLVKKLD
jgi:MFS family permease